MIKKRGKEIYQPPYAQDLSGFSANGQQVQPMGFCENGSTPIAAWCKDGSNPTQDASSCSPIGNTPEKGGCASGNNAAEGCNIGSYV